jgi:hypothetical protein
MIGWERRVYVSTAVLIMCLGVLSASAAGEKETTEPVVEPGGRLDNPTQRADAFVPSLFFDRLPQGLAVAGLMTAGASDRPLAEMDIKLAYRTPRLGRFGVELSTDAQTASHEPVLRAQRLGSGGRLLLQTGYGELWTGGSGGSAWDGKTWNEFTSVGGGWDIRTGRLSASLAIKGGRSARSFSNVSYIREGGAQDSMGTRLEQVLQRGTEKLSYTDAEMDLSWTHGKLQVGVLGGVRMSAFASAGSKSWLQFRNSYWFNENFALVLQGGRRQALPEMGLSGERFLAVAADIRLPGRGERTKPSTGSTTLSSGSIRAQSLLSVTRLAAGTCRITIAISRARTVLISGDFSNWEAVPMTRTASDTWQADIAARAGTYRVSVSIDGGPWQAPPGLAAQQDEFGQTAGMLFIR